ncbi:cytochrome P450 [Exidia glandulosa HHB12029]|uniref:Cytochrome P450 n=1 Tax=Exidia glandulosa HHB12029 TaxID=1314781 RepID=A0A165JI96_EXIGL|nr:cytochrome P450 [Exidia glandulosa HHB12029]
MAVSVAYAWSCFKARSKAPLPPGPTRHWLWQNMKDLPKSKMWLQFTNWADQYGPIVSLSLPGSKTLVVLQTLDTINDLLDKRGVLYSDRPHTIMANELMGFSETVTFQQEGPVLRRYRKLCRIALSPTAVERYETVQHDAVSQFIDALTENYARRPDGDVDFLPQIRLAAIRWIMGMVYGVRVEDTSHEYVTNAEAAIALFAKAIQPGRYFVDAIPIMRYLPEWLPFAKFKREAREARIVRARGAELPFRHVVDKVIAGTAPPSFVSLLLSGIDESNPSASERYEHEDIKQVARSMYSGMSPNSTLRSFVAAMLLHPEVQKKAQAELDTFYGLHGRTNLPTQADRQHLPYVCAVINETLRWQPSLPLAWHGRSHLQTIIPRSGFLIPKGSTILPNVWNVSRTGPDKETLNDFDPSRFMDDARRPLDPASYVFGFGRRVCVGQLVAENFLFVMVAAMLSSFTILPPLNNDGKEEMPKIEWVGAMPK